ncbi:conserved hypothetical protein [Thiobacillus denitrificans ATCC 25259]|uniref:DUF4142 domain-containing protein n=1 Tax=Thiobacillus denitrificans (strain ATCC 25259 / T1) TaxID=292415 RepID=Q3SKS8_THIDA|nr:DUF4142 domain-containing protein [Thiobacillus denitrificans]AAZ96697.1 conserved hypothetical protein [Thiobacillus denitrificans ATCC 25259]
MRHPLQASLLLAALAVAQPSFAQSAAITVEPGPTRPAAPSKADVQFAVDAAAAGLAEVEVGKIAMKRAASDGVRQFAEVILEDHSRANEKLTAIASQKNISIPKAPNDAARRRLDELQSLAGEAFDRALLSHARDDHQAAIALYSREAESGSDPELRTFASETLPKLQQHLQHVEVLLKAEAEKLSKSP